MNRKIFSLLITGLTGVSVAGAVISTNVGVDALKFGALRADNSVTLLLDKDNAAVTRDDFGETTIDWGTSDKSTRIYYSNAKSYDGGVCELANGATIKKANNAPSYGLSTFAASGAGELEIKTYFNDPNASESTYVYNYTLGENEITAYIVGNYFEVKAVGGNANIKTLKFGYDCNAVATTATGIHIAAKNNYAELFTGSDHKVRLNVELESDDTLDLSTFNASRITLRSSDNDDNYSIACYNLANRGGYDSKHRVAQFNLSDLNDQTGKWTQFTYAAKIYVDGKRIDGTNGNLYAEGTINTSSVQKDLEDDSQAKSGFKLGLDNTNKITTISWTNTINENDSVSNNGLRFVKMGTNSNVEYEHALSNAGDTGMYYNLFGWVATEEEALEVAKNYNRYSLRNATSSSTIENFVGDCVPGRCQYTAADGGYKVKLSFDLSGLRGDSGTQSGQSKGNVIAGLYYDNIPYMYRNDGNTSGLRTAYTSNEHHYAEDISLGYDFYYTHAEIFWGWVKLYAIHA